MGVVMDRLRTRISEGPRHQGWTRESALTAIIGAGILVILALVALHGVNKEFLGDGVAFALDADFSVSFFWTVLLFAGAAVMWWRMRGVRPEHQRVWTAMTVLCSLLALEGLLQLHSILEDTIGYKVNTLIIQPAIGIAVIALFVLCYRRLPAPERYLVAAAAATLVLAQLSSVVNGQLDLPYAGIILMQTLEEGFEMLTATLLLAAPAGLALGLPGRRVATAKAPARVEPVAPAAIAGRQHAGQPS